MKQRKHHSSNNTKLSSNERPVQCQEDFDTLVTKLIVINDMQALSTVESEHFTCLLRSKNFVFIIN